MSILEDTPIPIRTLLLTDEEGEEREETIYYKILSVHRRQGNPNKCIWTISLEEEVDCFRFSESQEWLENTKGWGLKIDSVGKLEQVGLSEQNEPLKIAKFVDSNSTHEWHGYPADYVRRQQDKPSQRVLMDWKEKGYISKTTMSKIKQCKKCNL